VKGKGGMPLDDRTDELDRRRVWLEVTPTGRKLLVASIGALREAREHLIASLGD